MSAPLMTAAGGSAGAGLPREQRCPTVTASVRGPDHSSVTAKLDDIRTTASLLRQVDDSLRGHRSAALGIEWSLPLRGDVLSPTTALACADATGAIALQLELLAIKASAHALCLDASASTYEAAERAATALISRIEAPALLATGLGTVAAAYASPAIGGPRMDEGVSRGVSLTIGGIDGYLPGDYETTLHGLSLVADTVFGSDRPVTTTMVAGPDAQSHHPPARSVSGALSTVAGLYEDDGKAAHIQVQRTVDPSTGKGSWVVMIPGTGGWGKNLRNPLDGGGNLTAAAGVNGSVEKAVNDALRDAMRREGVGGKDEPVMLVGHSQGGMVMTNVARHTKEFRVTRVVTVGSPVGGSRVPPGVRALNIEHVQDIVPSADGMATGSDDPRRTRVVMNDPSAARTASGGFSPIASHSADLYASNYAKVAAMERSNPASAVTQFERGSAGFFVGRGRSYSYDAARAPKPPPSESRVTLR